MGQDAIELIERLMGGFAERTGLDPVRDSPRRYLWTDAFAVCNLLELHNRTGERRYREHALRLVDQVHGTLGKHRPDDERSGWISGLDDGEGGKHPTAGGLRIGKQMNERRRDEPPDVEAEWEQDGQYYHYLTKWMHALERVSAATGDPTYLRWSMELAKAAHAHFTYKVPSGGMRMYWKMSIDLTYPLVPSMGQHDALDGLVTFMELRRAAGRFESEPFPDLGKEIDELAGMSRTGGWVTGDLLGAGSLLIDAHRLAQLGDEDVRLLDRTLGAGSSSVGYLAVDNDLLLPAELRLAFRELGLSIGLRAVERMDQLLKVEARSEVNKVLARHLGELRQHVPMAGRIEAFWSDPASREARTWREHEDINAVMLATSLAPDEFLRV
jgi:hypothetical protein